MISRITQTHTNNHDLPRFVPNKPLPLSTLKLLPVWPVTTIHRCSSRFSIGIASVMVSEKAHLPERDDMVVAIFASHVFVCCSSLFETDSRSMNGPNHQTAVRFNINLVTFELPVLVTLGVVFGSLSWFALFCPSPRCNLLGLHFRSALSSWICLQVRVPTPVLTNPNRSVEFNII